MSWTKKQIALDALLEIGVASYEYDVQAEEIENAVRRLDMLVAFWGSHGLTLSYPLPDSPEKTKSSSETNIPDWAALALVASLAVSIAPQYGKLVSQETKKTAALGMTSILKQDTTPKPRRSFPGMPLGAGNKTHIYSGRTFVPDEIEGITDIVGDTIEGL